MTREEIDKLEPGQKMNSLVHTVLYKGEDDYYASWYSYSTTSNWETIIESWKGDVELRRQNGYWKCTLFIPSYEYEMWGKTVAEAVCKAALLYYQEHKRWN